MATTIFFGNYKGGVGKTTSVFQIGINMAQKHDKKVLLLDLDPQASLSKICMNVLKKELGDVPVDKTLNYLLELYCLFFRRYSKTEVLCNKADGDVSLIKPAIFKKTFDTNKNGFFSFIPTRMNIDNARINDIAEQISRYSMGVVGVAKLLDDIENNIGEDFDYILIDCPPSLNSIIQAVFLKSDYYLIPTIADDISISGVMDYIKVIEKTILKYTYDSVIGGLLLEKVFSSPPKLLGILETMSRARSEKTSNDILVELNNQLAHNNIAIFENSKKYMRQSGEKNYIFESIIQHLDNRTIPSNYGVPYLTARGESHEIYDEITTTLVDIC